MRRPLAALGLVLTAFTFACTATHEPERTGEQRSALTGKLDSFYVVLRGPSAVDRIPRGVDPRSAQAGVLTRRRVVEIEAEHAALEPALEKEGALVVARLSRLANAIQIIADDEAARRIERLPGVRRVERVPLVKPALKSAVPVVGAPAVWAAQPMLQGDGITIGIIDSGIDYTHADFAGEGTSDAYVANDSKVIEPGSFPTAKIVGGWDFVGDDYTGSGANMAPKPDADPLDCTRPGSEQISGGHGTHVAGIAAGTGVTQAGASFDGPYEASFDPSAFRIGPGVAPRAKLYALKVFGCEGSTHMLAAALDRAADPNKDGMMDDRLDVVNGSLGTAYGLSGAMTGEMVTALAKVGTLFVAAAGNEGQNFFATGSPGSYPEVLSVAASSDNDLLTLKVTAPASVAAEHPAAEGDFTVRLATVPPIAAEIILSSPADGCTAFTNAAAVAGKVVLVRRGSCSFVEKVKNAADAGALAAVISDNEDAALPFVMNADPGAGAIPGVMVRQGDGAALEAALLQGSVTVGLDSSRYTGPGAEVLAGFSSRGPSSVDGRLKPEIAAPGGAIDSAEVGSGTQPRQSGGTSMASPMVAGAAALVRQARPGFSPLEVKAALVNAAAPLASFSSVQYGTSIVGGGRLDVARAVRALVTAAADPESGDVGVSFGAIVADAPTTVKRTFGVTNHGESAVTFATSVVSTHALPGVVITVSPPDLEVPAGATAMVELTLSLDPALLGSPGPDPGTPAMQGGQNPLPRHYLNEASGVVSLSPVGGGADAIALPFNGSVRAATRRKGAAPSACTKAGQSPEGAVEIALVGGGAHPEPVVTAFQLGALDPEDKGSKDNPILASTDLLAVGVATDLATAASFAEAQVFFGVAVSGPWTTAARGPISLVTIQINSDQKGSTDFEIRVEARNPDGPFRDSLVASTYNLKSGERVNRYPINIATPDVAKTHPFHNSVLVLSAKLSELGIDSAKPVFDWTARSERPDLILQGDSAKGTFDAAHPLIDTARYGVGGAPLFVGAGPVMVEVAPGPHEPGAPLDVLLLHHTNVPGERWEVVSLAPKSTGNLSLTAAAPASIAYGATGAVTLTVTNGSAEPAPNVRLDAALLGGEIASAEAAQGSCTFGASLDCALGDIPAGASVAVTATVRAAPGSASVGFDATVESDLECESLATDNAAVIQMLADPAPAPKPPEELDDLYAAGGCGCRAAGDAPDASRTGWLAAALGVLGMRLRRRRGGDARR